MFSVKGLVVNLEALCTICSLLQLLAVLLCGSSHRYINE